MRDIKFRIYDTQEKRYMYFDLLKNIDESKDYDLDYLDYRIRVYPEHIEQYTGLNDRNGKEIYEGDILEFMDAPGLGYGKATVIWYTDRASFFVENDDIDIFDYLFDIFDYSQIIGNIHEDSK